MSNIIKSIVGFFVKPSNPYQGMEDEWAECTKAGATEAKSAKIFEHHSEVASAAAAKAPKSKSIADKGVVSENGKNRTLRNIAQLR